MAFIDTPKDPEFFEQNRAPAGHVPNFVTTFAARPAVYEAWKQLNGAIKESFYTSEVVAALVSEPANDPVDRAVMAFARKVALSADAVTQDDVDALKALGLTDTDVLDVVLAAAARSFFSKTLDATGTPPDAAFNGLPETLRTALTVGRPIHSG